MHPEYVAADFETHPNSTNLECPATTLVDSTSCYDTGTNNANASYFPWSAANMIESFPPNPMIPKPSSFLSRKEGTE